jgi:hypothetical protein
VQSLAPEEGLCCKEFVNWLVRSSEMLISIYQISRCQPRSPKYMLRILLSPRMLHRVRSLSTFRWSVVTIYQTARLQTPEDSNLHSHHFENLQSYMFIISSVWSKCTAEHTETAAVLVSRFVVGSLLSRDLPLLKKRS